MVRDFAERLGLTVEIWRPGDGATRYRFSVPRVVNGELVLWPIATARGRALALAFLQGFEWGKEEAP